MADIITVGEILVEVMAKRVGQTFEESGIYEGPFPSGAPAIFIDQAAKCGSSTRIISAVGNDGFGRMNIKRLERDGVDTSAIHMIDQRSTGVAFVTYRENGDRDFLFHMANAACGEIDETFISENDFRRCRYFHIMGSSIFNDQMYRTIEKGIELAQQNQSKITFDPNVRKEILNDKEKKGKLVDILHRAHIILAGEDELFYLMDVEQEEERVQHLLNRQAEMVVIKRGSKGSTLFTKKHRVDVPAFPVQEVDPTGAGDCFGGTFVSCLNQGIDSGEAVRLSTLAGAFAVTKKGPMEGNTTLEELRSFMLSMKSN